MQTPTDRALLPSQINAFSLEWDSSATLLNHTLFRQMILHAEFLLTQVRILLMICFCYTLPRPRRSDSDSGCQQQSWQHHHWRMGETPPPMARKVLNESLAVILELIRGSSSIEMKIGNPLSTFRPFNGVSFVISFFYYFLLSDPATRRRLEELDGGSKWGFGRTISPCIRSLSECYKIKLEIKILLEFPF